jgi:hypothetical protein
MNIETKAVFTATPFAPQRRAVARRQEHRKKTNPEALKSEFFSLFLASWRLGG